MSVCPTVTLSQSIDESSKRPKHQTAKPPSAKDRSPAFARPRGKPRGKKRRPYTLSLQETCHVGHLIGQATVRPDQSPNSRRTRPKAPPPTSLFLLFRIQFSKNTTNRKQPVVRSDQPFRDPQAKASKDTSYLVSTGPFRRTQPHEAQNRAAQLNPREIPETKPPAQLSGNLRT